MSGHVRAGGMDPTTHEFYRVNGLVKAVIEEVLYVDDDKNNSVELYGIPSVQYGCRIIGGKYNGYYLEGVIDTNDLGGMYNSSETVRSAIIGQKLESTSGDYNPRECNGDFVLIGFLYGSLRYPMIIDGYPQPQGVRLGAKKEDGKRLVSEYNGIETRIDKDGNYRLQCRGLKDHEGTIQNQTSLGSEFIINKNGDIELNTYGTEGNQILPNAIKDLKIKLTKESKQLELLASESSVLMDSTGIKVEDKNSNKATLDSSGINLEDTNGNKFKMTSTGIELEDVNGNKIQMTSAGIILDSATQHISIDGSSYELHRHVGNIGVPTDIPLDAASD